MRGGAGLGPSGAMPSLLAAPRLGTRAGCGFLQPGGEGRGGLSPLAWPRDQREPARPLPCAPQLTLGAHGQAQL